MLYLSPDKTTKVHFLMKRILLIAAALLVCVAAWGQSFLESVTLSLDKGEEGVYAVGEPIKVFAESEIDAPAIVKVYINGNLNNAWRTDLSAGGKTEVFNASYDKPLALMVRLSNLKDEKDSTTVGAVVAPEQLKPGFDEPADFAKFWGKQLKTMRKMKMKTRLTPVAVPEKYEGKFVCYDLEINCVGNVPVRGYLAMPVDAKPRSLPIAIYAHSAGKLTKRWTRSTVDRAIKMAKYGNGAIGLDINAHGMLNDQPEEYYADLQEKLNGYSGWPIVDHENYYFRTMFLRMVRALDYLCTLKQWDRKKVLVTGGSQGGAQSAALAGLDKRVTHVVVDVPAMWDTGGCLLGRTSGWPKPIEHNKDNPEAARVASYYDGAVFLRHFKGELFVNVGLIDLTCPPASVWSAFNVCPASHKEIHPCAWKGHSGKYSLPEAPRAEVKIGMDKKIDEAIDRFLK